MDIENDEKNVEYSYNSENELITFEIFDLPSSLIQTMDYYNFKYPTKQQLNIIPKILSHKSIMFQTASGTGKSLCFAIPSIINYLNDLDTIIICPTRELSRQHLSTIRKLSQSISGVNCQLFIGGESYQDDILKLPCNIMIATPGRFLQLMKDDNIRFRDNFLFIFDEFDFLIKNEMFDESFEVFLKKFQQFSPQCIFCSATSQSVSNMSLFEQFNVEVVEYERTNVNLSIFHSLINCIDDYDEILTKTLEILEKIQITQCIIFSNDNTFAPILMEFLNSKGYKSACISGKLNQDQRKEIVRNFETYDTNVLISTDLCARGLDFRVINTVISIGLPYDKDTLVHRLGRTGRFDDKGLGILLVDSTQFETISKKWKVQSVNLGDDISKNLYHQSVSDFARERLNFPKDSQFKKEPVLEQKIVQSHKPVKPFEMPAMTPENVRINYQTLLVSVPVCSCCGKPINAVINVPKIDYTREFVYFDGSNK
eukprot:TRINITY_DN763_c0_g1_i1.p1 TRINITY_DN763_c0_g1~~TRINITY_DN763_c0_g1_i1.p1  ORF type:complete len:494 (-),score=123.03 TRINITY_DN763_c0_g1_i1:10-1461(-)